jgi:altronate dehydratase large subunit
MDGPAHDVISDTGMIAAGAQMIVFTTGRGSPLGAPIAPVIKVSSNSTIYNRMRDNIDINAGVILDAGESIKDVGKLIFREILEVASGKLTKSEIHGHAEFAIHTIGPTV